MVRGRAGEAVAEFEAIEAAAWEAAGLEDRSVAARQLRGLASRWGRVMEKLGGVVVVGADSGSPQVPVLTRPGVHAALVRRGDRSARRGLVVGLDDVLAPVNALLSWPVLAPSSMLSRGLGDDQDRARFWDAVRNEGGILARIGPDDDWRIVVVRAARRGDDQVLVFTEPGRSGERVVALAGITAWARSQAVLVHDAYLPASAGAATAPDVLAAASQAAVRANLYLAGDMDGDLDAWAQREVVLALLDGPPMDGRLFRPWALMLLEAADDEVLDELFGDGGELLRMLSARIPAGDSLCGELAGFIGGRFEGGWRTLAAGTVRAQGAFSPGLIDPGLGGVGSARTLSEEDLPLVTRVMADADPRRVIDQLRELPVVQRARAGRWLLRARVAIRSWAAQAGSESAQRALTAVEDILTGILRDAAAWVPEITALHLRAMIPDELALRVAIGADADGHQGPHPFPVEMSGESGSVEGTSAEDALAGPASPGASATVAGRGSAAVLALAPRTIAWAGASPTPVVTQSGYYVPGGAAAGRARAEDEVGAQWFPAVAGAVVWHLHLDPVTGQVLAGDGSLAPERFYEEIMADRQRPGTLLVIVGCRAAAVTLAAGESLAQVLARLAGGPVLAADTDVWTTRDGQVLAARPALDESGVPLVAPSGSWALAGNGEQDQAGLGADLLAILRGSGLEGRLPGHQISVDQSMSGLPRPSGNIRWSSPQRSRQPSMVSWPPVSPQSSPQSTPPLSPQLSPYTTPVASRRNSLVAGDPRPAVVARRLLPQVPETVKPEGSSGPRGALEPPQPDLPPWYLRGGGTYALGDTQIMGVGRLNNTRSHVRQMVDRVRPGRAAAGAEQVGTHQATEISNSLAAQLETILFQALDSVELEQWERYLRFGLTIADSNTLIRIWFRLAGAMRTHGDPYHDPALSSSQTVYGDSSVVQTTNQRTSAGRALPADYIVFGQEPVSFGAPVVRASRQVAQDNAHALSAEVQSGSRPFNSRRFYLDHGVQIKMVVISATGSVAPTLYDVDDKIVTASHPRVFEDESRGTWRDLTDPALIEQVDYTLGAVDTEELQTGLLRHLIDKRITSTVKAAELFQEPMLDEKALRDRSQYLLSGLPSDFFRTSGIINYQGFEGYVALSASVVKVRTIGTARTSEKDNGGIRNDIAETETIGSTSTSTNGFSLRAGANLGFDLAALTFTPVALALESSHATSSAVQAQPKTAIVRKGDQRRFEAVLQIKAEVHAAPNIVWDPAEIARGRLRSEPLTVVSVDATAEILIPQTQADRFLSAVDAAASGDRQPVLAADPVAAEEAPGGTLARFSALFRAHRGGRARLGSANCAAWSSAPEHSGSKSAGTRHAAGRQCAAVPARRDREQNGAGGALGGHGGPGDVVRPAP